MAKELVMKVGRICKHRLAWHDLCARCCVNVKNTNTFHKHVLSRFRVRARNARSFDLTVTCELDYPSLFIFASLVESFCKLTLRSSPEEVESIIVSFGSIE